MREINKTFYEVLKLEEPEDGINVTQIMTDDLINRQSEGEAKAVRGATELLNRKADELYKEKERKSAKKVLKATGNKTKSSTAPPVPPTSEASKKVTKKKVVKKAVTKKKVVKKAPTPSVPEKKKTSPVVLLLLILIIAGVGGYVYMELM